MAVNLGIDIGTSSTQVYSASDGRIIVNEPTIVAVSGGNEVVAAGAEAFELVGKTADSITVETPVRDGAITNFDMAVALLKKLTESYISNVFSKVRAAVSVPSGIGDVEKRAVEEVVISAGVKDVFLIEAPLAGAIGAGIDVNEPKGYVIMDIGAGTTEVAVVSLGGVVVSKSVKVAGDALDYDIVQYIKKRYNIEIAKSAAEKIKISIGSAFHGLDANVINVKGKDMYSGVPKNIVISANEVHSAIKEDVAAIVETVRRTLEDTPPELASDLLETGIILTGGGAALTGLGKLIQNSTGVKVYLAEDPVCCVASGAGTAVAESGGFRNMLTQAVRKKNF
ncbi:MAG TPA: rod shape-determining protein [Candidatus Monoglobus merdigallinarum]|uniref:Cell shape-determining protein MreB n=1 Tax=Candidatus Monoglobus merdigallinarum TaxID=2838698 RepID=A0A9D1PQ98_9FIRM|nr:rod shape-determining protein [Candidatus Monoglobus merdigallinarum]